MMRNFLCLTFCVFLLVSCRGTKKTIEISERPQEKSVNKSITTTVDTIETRPDISNIVFEDRLDKVTANVSTEHQLWNNLLEKYVSNDGLVDYQGFKKDYIKLEEYITVLQNSLPKKESSKNYKLAYWINAYNAFTVDLILRHYPIKSIKEINKPWKQRLWKLEDKWYNLDEIEHQILRKMNEPRIHFAIVCASYSCPKLQNEAFTTFNLETQLRNATKEFLSDTERNEISENELKLSKIFQWFSKDFNNGSLIDYLNVYTDVSISEKAKISYKDYSWNLNE
ncbi:DUF547 domain-containing protein [Seonamhaeicola aphaedonensis]|uniref:Uncharacterized protein DUF547 n=1 Tax=Seonamhaeicola aphaedonensis TaxID=1461338 RepID=A0A3D9HL55_9FLAO|nr:DUF547 domain-containing protein [Seonamhaeicola aphaedonensis]RED50214.1 uncharacterized protein DUF547 [Seonamhaeicola aphaedonensis]